MDDVCEKAMRRTSDCLQQQLRRWQATAPCNGDCKKSFTAGWRNRRQVHMTIARPVAYRKLITRWRRTSVVGRWTTWHKEYVFRTRPRNVGSTGVRQEGISTMQRGWSDLRTYLHTTVAPSTAVKLACKKSRWKCLLIFVRVVSQLEYNFGFSFHYEIIQRQHIRWAGE